MGHQATTPNRAKAIHRDIDRALFLEVVEHLVLTDMAVFKALK